jgi:hypothetical protein
MARPCRYTPDIAERILDQIRTGRPLREVCGDPGMPSARTVQGWVRDDRDGFAAAYGCARRIAGVRLGHGPAWSAGLAERILHQLRSGRTLIDVCRDPAMPRYATVRDWVTHDRYGFAARYREALRAGGARWARPTRYAADIAAYILDGLCAGRSLADLCREPLMPTEAAVRRWVAEDREGFAGLYWYSRQIGCETLMDEMVSIADSRDGDWIEYRTENGQTRRVLDDQRIVRAELALKAREWLLSRMLRASRWVERHSM